MCVFLGLTKGPFWDDVVLFFLSASESGKIEEKEGLQLKMAKEAKQPAPSMYQWFLVAY